MSETKTKCRNDSSITKEIIPSMPSICNNNGKENKDQFEDANDANTDATARSRIRSSSSRRRIITSSVLTNNVESLSMLFTFRMVAPTTNNYFKFSTSTLLLTLMQPIAPIALTSQRHQLTILTILIALKEPIK